MENTCKSHSATDSNLSYHIIHYRNVMVLYSKMFPSTLKGPIMKWYSELPTRSIDCFETLVDLFTNTYFVYHNTRDESLRAYLMHFRAELVEVEKIG
ncbi:hypothetical protein DVH24_002092 [Malus domestica]|uniref:Retrotransposon gag domain-containing protein n=1 Tax=Malus domestica TaxID=3750 RepID=A0A498I8R4_MALDO|nr:hypothetical protein DVH24_002092 [Malus domestica]